MADNTESGGVEWAVKAANGHVCYSSEENAKAAVSEPGWTLGVDRSPIVAALFRARGSDDWQTYSPGISRDGGS